jgi:hypothetical protein
VRIAKINPRTVSTPVGWNNYTTAQGRVTGTLTDTDGQSTPWTWIWDETAVWGNSTNDSFTDVGEGDADWVSTSEAYREGHGTNNSSHWEVINIGGLDDSKKYDIYATARGPTGRITQFRVNGGGDIQAVDNFQNKTQIAFFTNLQPSAGYLTLEVRRGTGSSGWSYFSAAMLVEYDTNEPSVSLEGVFAYGSTMTAIPLNYAENPDTCGILDSANNSISPTLSFDGNDYTFPMPALPAPGESINGLILGPCTVTIFKAEE